jgi:AcrR family transcriptional regulator
MDQTRTTKKEVLAAFRTQEILAATRRLMERGGVDALTMDEIAQAAGVAKGTIYLYFQSKDELIQALLSEVGEAIAKNLEALLARPDSPREKLKQVVILLLNFVEQESLLFPVYLRELVRSKSGRETRSPLLQDLEERIVGQLNQLFAEGIAQGQFIPASPRLLSFLLKGLVRAVGYYQMTGEQENAIQQALPVVLRLFFSGILVTPEIPPEEATV